MAKRGAQKGNRNAAKDKSWETALRATLKTYAKGDVKQAEALEKIAERCITMALEGDLGAITEIANRIDGKPIERIEFNDKTKRQPSYAQRLEAEAKAAAAEQAAADAMGHTVQ